MSRRQDAPGWPATLVDGRLTVRPLLLRDAAAWVSLRRRNATWLAPWESTPPGRSVGEATAFGFLGYANDQRRAAATGAVMPFALDFDGVLIGQLTVGGISRGAMNGATIGYWIDRAHAGRGLVPTAVALVTDHCFGPGLLHRVEINVRPENAQSLRVVSKLGFREEGLRRGFLYVDGAYRDHVAFALLREDVAPSGLLARWKKQAAQH